MVGIDESSDLGTEMKAITRRNWSLFNSATIGQSQVKQNKSKHKKEPFFGLILCVWLFCLHVCAPGVWSAHRSQKRALEIVWRYLVHPTLGSSFEDLLQTRGLTTLVMQDLKDDSSQASRQYSEGWGCSSVYSGLACMNFWDGSHKKQRWKGRKKHYGSRIKPPPLTTDI